MPADRVVLSVPAKGEYARTVRMTAAELGARLGMTFDNVDDVRIAAEEAFVFASGRTREDDLVTFTFGLDEGVLSVLVGPMPTACSDGDDDEASSEYAAFILESVCDEFAIEESSDSCTLRLVKRLS